MKIEKSPLLFILLILAGLIVPSASAASFAPDQIVPSTISAAKKFFTPIFTSLFNTNSGDKFLFAKILLAILLFVMISSAVKRFDAFKDQKGIIRIIALVVSILAVRFISEEGVIAGILLPYSTLGIVLTTFLPFLILFYFLHDSQIGPFGRKAAWLLFAIVFVVLWYSRWDELGDISKWIYGFTLIGMALAYLGDKSVHSYFASAERKKKESGHIRDRINELSHKRDMALYARDVRRVEEIDGEIKELEKKL